MKNKNTLVSKDNNWDADLADMQLISKHKGFQFLLGKFHPSILFIQNQKENHNIFSFKTVEVDNIKKEINNIKRQQLITAFVVKI